MTTEAREEPRTDLPTGAVTFLLTDTEGSTRLSPRLGHGFHGHGLAAELA